MPSAKISDQEQAEIIMQCGKHERNEHSKPGFRPQIILGQYFIKYAGHYLLEPQCKTQQYIYERTVGDATAPRVPEVYGYFTADEHCMAYLVMEYINPGPTPARNAPKEVAEALQWLRRLPAPRDVAIGSVGGGPARHRLFREAEAPLLFSSKEALERYMNRAFEWIPRGCLRPEKVDFSDEWPVFTQSNMDESNFCIDTNGKVCIVDFQDVGLLPQSFASWTVHRTIDPFTCEVAKSLDWPASPNLPSMRRVGEILQMLADTTMGLDEDGELKAWP